MSFSPRRKRKNTKKGRSWVGVGGETYYYYDDYYYL